MNRTSTAAQRYKQALEMVRRNLKKLADAGVRIAFGIDSGQGDVLGGRPGERNAAFDAAIRIAPSAPDARAYLGISLFRAAGSRTRRGNSRRLGGSVVALAPDDKTLYAPIFERCDEDRRRVPVGPVDRAEGPRLYLRTGGT